MLIVRYGIYGIEHLFLEELARDRRHGLQFVCLPLKMQGGHRFTGLMDRRDVRGVIRGGGGAHASSLDTDLAGP